MKISAVILTKNEEKNIEDCLQTLQWCDEVIVIDDESTDSTVALAKKHGATVYAHRLDGNFAASRNFGLKKASGEWIFFVDADERISPALRDEIIKKINNPLHTYQGFFIKRLDSMWGKVLKHGEIGDIRILRLAKRNAGEWKGTVHETWGISGSTETLSNPILHFPHQTIAEFLTEINFYTTLRAQELFDQRVKASWIDILAYPKAKFFMNYIIKVGFLDGVPGLIFALLMSLHSFLVRGKLWQLWQKK